MYGREAASQTAAASLLALDPARRNELSRNHAGIETAFAQLASPVVGTAASLHRHQSVCGQFGTPGQVRLPLERPVRDHPASGIVSVDLDNFLGQTDADAWSVALGTSLSNGIEIDFQHANLGTSMP